MPIYEYECTECSKKKESLRKIIYMDLPATCICKGQMKRIISPSEFHLKGHGRCDDGYGIQRNPKYFQQGY